MGKGKCAVSFIMIMGFWEKGISIYRKWKREKKTYNETNEYQQQQQRKILTAKSFNSSRIHIVCIPEMKEIFIVTRNQSLGFKI